MYASYDLENYNKFIWDESKFPDPGYILIDKPFTLDTLICLYGDSCNSGSFSPDFYPRSNPFEFGDSTFYFEPQDFNASTFGVNTPIRKIYPDQPYPSSLIPDSAQVDELTEDGFLKYFEYETTIENLLPTVPYYVNVTAFDFGSRSPESQLSALETSKSNGAGSDSVSNITRLSPFTNKYESNQLFSKVVDFGVSKDLSEARDLAIKNADIKLSKEMTGTNKVKFVNILKEKDIFNKRG